MVKKKEDSGSLNVAPKRPFKDWKAGNMQVAVWKNKKDMQDGSEVEFKTVSLTRSYRKTGEELWRHDVINLRRNDLQKAILLLQKAQEDMLLSDRSRDEEAE
jgi:hypothetical protein